MLFRSAKKLLADCETWDKAMRELAAKNLTGLANDWLSQDEENPQIGRASCRERVYVLV